MFLTKAKEIPLVKLKINNNLIEQVKQLKHVGCTLTSNGEFLNINYTKNSFGKESIYAKTAAAYKQKT